MEDSIEFVMPQDIRNLRKNLVSEGCYKMRGIGKSYDPRRFSSISRSFTDEVDSNILMINQAKIFEPLYYMIIKQANTKKINDDLDDLVTKLSETLDEVVSNDISDMESDFYYALLRYCTLMFAFIEGTTSEKKGKGVLEKEMSNENRYKISEDLKNLIDIHSDIAKAFKVIVGKSGMVIALKRDSSLLKNFRRMMKSMLMSPMSYINLKGKEYTGMEAYHDIYKVCIKEEIIKENDLIYDLAFSLNDYEVTVKSVIYLMESFGKNETHSDYEFFVSCLTRLCTDHCMTKTSSKVDNNAVKNYKDFYMGMAKKFPEVFESNLSEFLFLLDSKCYQFRNVLYEILKNVLLNKYLEIADEDPNKENKLRKKNEYIRLLIGDEDENGKKSRTLDMTSFSRSYVLSVLDELFLVRKVDNEDRVYRIFDEGQIHHIFKLASSRVKDKSSLVRRKALKICSDIMEFFNKEMRFAEYDSIEADYARANKDIQELLQIERRSEEERRLKVLNNFKDFLDKCKSAYSSMNNILPLIAQIINYEPESSDSLEAIKLMGKMNRLGLSTTKKYMPKLFSLIFIKDINVKREVMNVFLNIFNDGRRKINATKKIASYMKEADLLARKSIEEILLTLFQFSKRSASDLEFRKKGYPELDNELVVFAWTQFTTSCDFYREQDSNDKDRQDEKLGRPYLSIFRVGLEVWPELFDLQKSNQLSKKIISVGNKTNLEWGYLMELSNVMQRLSLHQDKVKICSILSKYLLKILTNNQGREVFEWYGIARNIIKTMFKVFDVPLKPAEFFIRKLSEFITGEKVSPKDFYEEGSEPIHIQTQMMASHYKSEGIDIQKFSQLIFVVGEIVLNLTIYFEHIELETEKIHKGGQKIEDELVQATAGFDSTLNKQKKMISDIQKLLVNEKGILPVFIPIIFKLFGTICENSKKVENYGEGSFFHQVIVQTVCKFMIASKQLCESQATEVFKLMDSMISQSIKMNIIVCFSDLLRRYPSIIEKKISHLFSCLKSESYAVRKVSLKLIIHLVLIDMIKIKQKVTDIIMMMDDPEKEISDLAKLFFLELHKKESQIIDKMIPDILSSMAEKEEINFEKFKNYTKHILGYIDKAKQANELAARMILRLSSSVGDNYRELVFSSICLNILMEENPNIFKKIYDEIDSIKIHFSIKKVRENFQEMIQVAYDIAEKRKNNKSNKIKLVHVEAVKEKMKSYLEMGEEYEELGRARKEPVKSKDFAKMEMKQEGTSSGGKMVEEDIQDSRSQRKMRRLTRSAKKESEEADKENGSHQEKMIVDGLKRLRRSRKSQIQGEAYEEGEVVDLQVRSQAKSGRMDEEDAYDNSDEFIVASDDE